LFIAINELQVLKKAVFEYIENLQSIHNDLRVEKNGVNFTNNSKAVFWLFDAFVIHEGKKIDGKS